MDRRFLLLTGLLSAVTFGSVWSMLGAASASGTAPGDRTAAVYYPGCHAVRAAGATPLYRGQPGYRPEMDGDNDGIACEPVRDGVSETSDRSDMLGRRRRR